MYAFHRTGIHATRLLQSIGLFFVFFGHLCHSALIILFGNLRLTWSNVTRVLYHSGVQLVMPLALISGLLTVSVTINCYLLLTRFNLQHKTLSIIQDIITADLVPVLIGFVLVIQSSLNLINARIKITKRQHSPEEVILDYVLPIMIGIGIAALLLYTYVMAAVAICLYLTFDYFYQVSAHEFIFQMAQSVTLDSVVYSICKTLLYGNIVSLTAGYYYYQVAVSQIPIRRGVSCILTRGSSWLLLTGITLKFITN